LYPVTFLDITLSIMIPRELHGGGFGEKKRNKLSNFVDFCL